MAKYRVYLERNGCIGAATCVGAHPEHWKMRLGDNKVDILGGTQILNSDDQEIIIDESDLASCKLAAEVCPVNIIHITNLETGEQVI